MDVDEEWEQFMTDESVFEKNTIINEREVSDKEDLECPKATDIYISTKSKIAYLNTSINLHEVFWKLKTMLYTVPENGIVKKQMKFNSSTQEEVDIISTNIKNEYHVIEQILTSVNDPSGVKNWFKDVRKISIGVSKKDIISYRSKQKCAFYNCFVMILRVMIDDPTDPEDGLFHEFHVKVFNTGKIEIPGIRSDYHLQLVLDNILIHLKPIIGEHLGYTGKCDTVLINSNFNCGFFINREKLFDILKDTYNIQCIFDPCSYPGIQCKFYYDKTKKEQSGIREHVIVDKNPDIVVMSFMIFRTGSILIVGMCEEYILDEVYVYIKTLLQKEFNNIYQSITDPDTLVKSKPKKTKIRKRYIIVDTLVS